MGKNWARGLTAATDARVARSAAGRRGLRYKLHTSRDRRRQTSGPRFTPPGSDEDWTPGLAYAVGLIATDGCLSNDGKTVAQVSKDRDLLETFKRCIGSEAKIGWNRRAYRVQVVDVGLYRWLEATGLTQRKSLTLGRVGVPDAVFLHFVRGLLDGDGSILVSMVVPNPRRYPVHRYQRLRVQFLTASETHATWLRAEINRLLGLAGWLNVRLRPGVHPQYVVRYSKHESIALLKALYADPSAPRLERKWARWNDFSLNGKPTRVWSRRSGETWHPRSPQERVGESP